MKCILHIGTEKTGTTLIQNWLYENKDNLSKQGVGLTTKCLFPNNRNLVSFFQTEIDEHLTSCGVFSESEKEAYFRNFRREFAEEITALRQQHHTVIFTSEHFHSRLTEADQISNLRDFLGQYFFSYEIVCYFREQSRVRTSLYSTTVKVSNGGKLEDFQKNLSDQNHYYNYFVFFQKWEAAFGKQALRPRLFDRKSMVQNDIRVDFLRTVLPDVPLQALTFKTKSANESITNRQAFIFRAINRAQPKFLGETFNPAAEALKETASKIHVLEQSGPIQDPDQRAVFEIFNDSNVLFFDRYFGEARNIFDPPDSSSTGLDVQLSHDEMEDSLEALLSTAGLVVLTPKEIDTIRDIALHLDKQGDENSLTALCLINIARRARPDGPIIASEARRIRRKNLVSEVVKSTETPD